jgi:hypothetical protein
VEAIVHQFANVHAVPRDDLRKNLRDLLAHETGHENHVVHAHLPEPDRMPLEQRPPAELEQNLRGILSQAHSPSRRADDRLQAGGPPFAATGVRKEKPSA